MQSTSKESSFCIDQVAIKETDTRWVETVQIEKTNVKFKLDTGADVNVLPLSIYDKLKESY